MLIYQLENRNEGILHKSGQDAAKFINNLKNNIEDGGLAMKQWMLDHILKKIMRIFLTIGM